MSRPEITGSVALLAGLLALPGTAGADEIVRQTLSPAPHPELAQAICGWFAIYHCSPGLRDARRFARRYRGSIIDTDDPRYPTFRPGFYCVVDGPTGKGRAQRLADEARYAGVAPDAYIKDPCHSNPG